MLVKNTSYTVPPIQQRYHNYLGHLVLYDFNSDMYQNCAILVIPELFLKCSNSRTYLNCAIPVRTRVVRLHNSGTCFIPVLLLQFWDVPELSMNYFPAAGRMMPIVKCCAANIHFY